MCLYLPTNAANTFGLPWGNQQSPQMVRYTATQTITWIKQATATALLVSLHQRSKIDSRLCTTEKSENLGYSGVWKLRWTRNSCSHKIQELCATPNFGNLNKPYGFQPGASGTLWNERKLVDCRYSTREVYTNYSWLPFSSFTSAQPSPATGPRTASRHADCNLDHHNPVTQEIRRKRVVMAT